ncbi:hypothetical protein HZS_8139 [Henneguya salminicola]|nr:hypothetical protein HZS_8139 [Henneguya salminicola]
MVIEIGGAITNVPIVYIFPSMCSLMIYGKPYLEFNIKKILSWIILLLGIIMLFGCPYLTIKSLVTKSDFMPIEKYYCEKN